mmetsp:Transcript_71999/g.188688  ORF Transcript_71999/g.188688 Transcript_71999/m.188688 type:complete len:244 (-) Transcript_71999:82-813(-)
MASSSAAQAGDAAAAPGGGEEELDIPLQQEVDDVISRLAVDMIVARSIRDSNVSISIADPQIPDTPLIAVSQGFCALTGYAQESVVGRNCRFLNDDCDMRNEDREGLREASASGKHFCALLPNVRADGTPFLNLLDMQGLAVGRTNAGVERWFLVGIQADMSDQVAEGEDLSLEKKLQMQCVADVIRDELRSVIQEAAIIRAEANANSGAAAQDGDNDLGYIMPYQEPRWVVGEVSECPALGG